jgi:hypothetical protein
MDLQEVGGGYKLCEKIKIPFMLLPIAQHEFESGLQYSDSSVIMSKMVLPTLELKDAILVCP